MANVVIRVKDSAESFILSAVKKVWHLASFAKAEVSNLPDIAAEAEAIEKKFESIGAVQLVINLIPHGTQVEQVVNTVTEEAAVVAQEVVQVTAPTPPAAPPAA